jgi:CHAT domain-containing protein
MDIPVEYHDGRSSFRETLSPVYLGYANQLLKKAALQTGDEQQKSLILARSSVEQIKQTEMEDFLGGRCLIEGLRRSELDSLDSNAATIYPIILADRLEILVGIGKTIHQFSVPVTEKQLHTSAITLADKLRNMEGDYKQHAEKLYLWLIAPIEKQLEVANIKTLVIIPDGVLRLVPFSSLYDGKQYLLEKYAISVSPGISLMAGGKSNASNFNTLLAGLSKPGDVVEKLPFQIVTAILEPGQRGANQRALPGTRSLGGISLRAEAIDKRRQAEMRSAEQLLRTPGAVQKLQEELSLPGVENEINKLKLSVKNTTILNGDFTVASFHQLATSQNFDMIHIASHGVFSSDAESSFLMAHDNVLKIDDIQSLLKGDNPAKSIELLTLSACETAEGDDRAPLGFTGMALKANARSAVGSLWPISDVAASQLMVSFYKNLGKNNGKAEALRQAQLELLANKELGHPFFWSPFILVGDWM